MSSTDDRGDQSATEGPPDARQGLLRLFDASGLNQAELARAASMTPANVSKILSGKMDPGSNVLRRLLGALGARWGDLD